MRVGIYTPYARQEAAYLAIALAGQLTTSGHKVSLCTSSNSRGLRPVHPDWDSRVVSRKPNELRAWGGQQQHLICLQPLGLRLIGVPTTLVLRWHQEWWVNPAVLAEATYCLSPWPCVTRNFQSYFTGAAELIECQGWNAGGQPRPNPLPSGNRRTGVLCYWGRQDDPLYLEQIVELLERLAAAHPEIELICPLSKTIKPQLRHRLEKLLHNDRGFMVQSADLATLQHLIQRSDLVWCLERQVEVGHTALLALSSGVPVVAYRETPYTEFIEHGRQGWLIDCPTWQHPAPETTLAVLDQALGELGQAVPNEGLTQRHQRFNGIWQSLLSLG